MVTGKQPNHKDHDLALTTLLNTARKYNGHLNYEKLQYKQKEVEFFRETYTVDDHSQLKVRLVPYKRCQLHNADASSTMQETGTIIYWHG